MPRAFPRRLARPPFPSGELAGNSGRIYLPPDWIGKRVKIIRVE
ncbi:MAG: DUF2080 family transposase-associated protein [Methanobacteriota archaeon]|nr:MAG: DUF2080 family transposase-associated protein [Euryarchaeota archaeon]